MSQQSSPPSSPRAGQAVSARGIVFVHPEPAPSFVAFATGRTILGRDPAAGLLLDGKAVSWQHAELSCTATEAFIRDLDSTNGVIVEGHRVREARLADRTVVRIGDFLGVVAHSPARPDADLAFPEATRLGLVVGPMLAQALAPLHDLPLGSAGAFTLEGETGTGKSLVARLLHARLRPQGPFTTIDCATLNEGTTWDRVVSDAARGVVLLSNLTALPAPLQIRLADVLRGDDTSLLCLIAGSQEPLEIALQAGHLLPALFDLLAATPARRLRLPPLRERLLDIAGLFRHLLVLHGRPGVRARTSAGPSLSTELVERLCLYDWPCNVREMVLIVQRLIALHGDEPRLRAAHLPARLAAEPEGSTTSPVAPVAGVELGALLDAVRDAGGNVADAALRLGITRERAYRLIDRLGLARGSA
jgi:two-component system response regulator GlrR